MNLQELFVIKLDEVRQAPSNLKQFAKSEAAKGIMAGFEAELVFKDAKEGGYGYDESEPDYDEDRRTRSIDDICDFFEGNGDWNSGREINDLRDSLSNDFFEYMAEASSEHFFANETSIVKDYIEGEDEWDLEEEIETCLSDDMDLPPDEVKAALAAGKKYTPQITSSKQQRELRQQDPDYDNYLTASAVVDEKLDLRVEKEIEEQGDIYYAAQENAREAFEDDFDQSDWLENSGLRYMSDVQNRYTINWPYWTYSDDEEGFSEEAAETLADSLREIIPDNQRIEVTNWAGKDKDPDTWYFESDSSIDADESTDLPVEIVSPPMPLDQCLEMLDKFFKWADDNGAYSNKSTGFHMGVSMPEQDSGKIDFTKLALFLGDKYVLQEFGRLGNTYCKSALKIIETRVSEGKVDAKKALEALRHGLDRIASEVVASNEGFGKFVTINPKKRYIEFRSAGGEDYSKDINKLQDTLMRYAQAMWIASDSSRERNEYQKKLYKLLDRSNDTTDAITELARMAAGKETDEDIRTWQERVRNVLRTTQRMRKGKAVELEPAEKKQATSDNGVPQWEIYDRDTGHVLHMFTDHESSAVPTMLNWLRSIGAEDPSTYAERFGVRAKEVPTHRTAQQSGGEFTGRWKIVSGRTGETLHTFGGIGNSQSDANRTAAQWARQSGFDDPIEVYPIMS